MNQLRVASPLFVLTLLLAMTACRQPGIKKHDLKTKIDSLQLVIDNSYKPGTGEIMSNIVQPHHYKLWLAGKTGNWELAKYESHMIAGGFKRIQKYHPGTPEANSSAMMYPQLAAIEKAIQDKDAIQFNKDFEAITQTCNTCHQATKYQFNVIKIPADPKGFPNQEF